jgi:excisionase family DNA binding protein
VTDALLTIKEVSARLKVSRWTVSELIDTGGLEAIDISTGTGGKTGKRRPTWRITEASLTQWQESRPGRVAA